MKKTAVLIPCYNEALTVEKVITDFRNALPEADIYVYDNNSTDGTADLAEKSGLSCVMNIGRGREMWCVPCFEISMRIVTFW